MMRRFLLGVMTLNLAACGSSPGEQANDLIERSNEIFTEICECSQELFEQTAAECIDDNIDGPENVDCLDAAYELNEEASEAHLDCERGVLDDLDSCISSADTCSEQAVCLQVADDAEDLCPELPDAVREAVRDCDD